MMVLLSLVTLAMLSLSATELRRSTVGQHRAQARANAKLALAEAIAQLQRNLGPDQRVSASGDLATGSAQPHWTGAWSTRQEDGSSIWQRDPETGSWTDARQRSGDPEPLEWLVSGGGRPSADGDSVALVAAGSVGDHDGDRVTAPLIPIEDGGKIGWWVGDLGVRANLAVPDAPAVAGKGPVHDSLRLLANQQADAGMMTGGRTIGNDRRDALASPANVGMAMESSGWGRQHFHDFTIHSRGVQADVRDGGLKRDLSAYIESEDGAIASHHGLDGIRDDASILDEAGQSPRHRFSGPCFGVMRDWARRTEAFDGTDVAGRTPEPVSSGDAGKVASTSRSMALANERPTLLRNRSSKLQPILVEASHYLQISTFETKDGTYQLRHHLYPRVVLWNPYNVELDSDPSIVMIQGNGRQEMWTQDASGSRLAWLSFEGGRKTEFVNSLTGILASDDYHDPYMGSYYFSVPETRIGPGECLVFSPARSAEYDALSAYKQGAYNLANNELSCEVAPDPARSYYVSGSDIGGGVRKRQVKFWYAPTPFWWVGLWRGIENQADDTRVVMKSMRNASEVTYESFDRLPQIAYLSASLQYGAGKEPRIKWHGEMDLEFLTASSPKPTLAPSVRTREGIRMRWFEEHPSNRLGSGPLGGSGILDEAPFANWNPRAAYAVRSPWENIAGTIPVDGGPGGPWFFGIYTRDLYDENVGWSDQTPVFREGRYHGNPFGLPQEGRERNILFEVPRDGIGVVSLGQFQQAQFSEFVWHPAFAFGNSLPDPRLGLDGLEGTVPPSGSEDEDHLGGFHADVIGWSSDQQRSQGKDDWARTARALLQEVPEGDHVVYDLSYELNHALWDRFFVSSGDRGDKEGFLSDPDGDPLPSGRMRLSEATRADASVSDLSDFHRSAYHLVVDGAFNVNSTRVEAWKALLASARGLAGADGTPVGRILDPPESSWSGGDPGSASAWAGRRELSDEEIELLAEAIVEEVRTRGPFLSLADFVNRRLADDETGRSGALQAAIDRAGLNSAFESAGSRSLRIDNDEEIGDYRHPDNIRDATRLEQRLKPSSKAWGAPGFLTQADLLQGLAPVLSARSDSFVIRAYGDARDASGKVLSSAWCEAVVQRTPVPVHPDDTGLNSERQGMPGDFGRRFELVSFRWLHPEEV